MVNNNADSTGDIAQAAIKQLVSSPAVAVALFFMWLCGIVISFIFIDNNKGFKKNTNKNSWFFNLALGFLPGAIVMMGYHVIAHREMLTTLEHLNQSALPSALILAGIVCVTFFVKAIRS